MTDPNTTDNPETRTWERMETGGEPIDRDAPFEYFMGGNPDDDPDF